MYTHFVTSVDYVHPLSADHQRRKNVPFILPEIWVKSQNVPKYGTFLPVSMSHLIIVMSHLVIYNEFEHIFCPKMTFYYTCYEIHALDVGFASILV